MKSAPEILSDRNIRLTKSTYGNHRTTCPECSNQRRDKRDPCLSVNIDPKGVRYQCWHCGWHGGAYYDGSTPPAQPSGRPMGARGKAHQRFDPKQARRAVRYREFSQGG